MSSAAVHGGGVYMDTKSAISITSKVTMRVVCVENYMEDLK